MLKINSTKVSYSNCTICNAQIQIKLYNNPKHINFGQPIVAHKNKITCSRACHKQWQLSLSWEERIGKDKAEQIRANRSITAKANNPSTRPGTANKISKTLKLYFNQNPKLREGIKNPFFGRKHKAETIEHWKNTKKGKWAYNQEQKLKQEQNTLKKEKHPNWQGGIANGEYGSEFNQELKTYIKESYNHTCQLCDVAGVELDVHHIDYDKKNNLPNNLIPLCKICHGKTNYDREKWQKLLTKN